jgi:hypothetical protein
MGNFFNNGAHILKLTVRVCIYHILATNVISRQPENCENRNRTSITIEHHLNGQLMNIFLILKCPLSHGTMKYITYLTLNNNHQ